MSKEGEGMMEVPLSREERIRQLAENRYDYRRLANIPGTPADDWKYAEKLYEDEERNRLTDLQRGGY